MRRLRYSGKLLRELTTLAKEHKAYWMVPLTLLILLIGLLVVASQGAAPYIYTLF